MTDSNSQSTASIENQPAKISKFHSHGVIGLFARHKVAPNLLMIIIFILGTIALMRLNIQFFPNFELDLASVQVTWNNANAEDVERSVTEPLERVLRNIDDLKEMKSTSALGTSVIYLKFEEGTNMIEALDRIRQRVGELRNLPQDSEKPVIKEVIRYDAIASLLLTSESGDLNELRPLARQFERELLDAGVDKVSFVGLPEEEMAIEIPQEVLHAYELSISQVADTLRSMSRDMPAGSVGDDDSARDVRSVQQGRTETDFLQMPLVVNETENVALRDVAKIQRQPKKHSAYLMVDGKPAIEMTLMRSESGDTFESYQIMQQWLDKTRPQLPDGVQIQVYDEKWTFIDERISLLLTNGLGGLVLVVLILYLFMNGRVAFWVAVGIPISFMATLTILYLIGGSINMVSLFALIMALGIIVDDAIVVGEDALSHYEMGENALQAAEGGAHRMLAPVTASSLTTVAAFAPLMLIGAEIGNIIFAIPLVIIAVVLASLLESFFILPGHLRHAFHHVKPAQEGSIRYKLDKSIEHFRQVQFRKLIRWALNNRSITLTTSFALLVFVISLLVSGRVSFVFFPSPEPNLLFADARFVAGTNEKVTADYVEKMYQALRETEQELEPGMVKTAVLNFNRANKNRGSNVGSITIELLSSDQRETRNAEFIRVFQEKSGKIPGLDILAVREPENGPPGSDIEVRMSGVAAEKLKMASLELQEVLAEIPGVSGIKDDLPFGRDQLIYELTPQGKALGFTYASVGQQLSDAFSSRLVQIFNDNEDEVEVRVQLPREEQAKLSSLSSMQLFAPNGQRVPISTVVTWKNQQGFNSIHHVDGRLTLTVSGDVDKATNNPNRILADLEANILPDLVAKYGFSYSLEGQKANQEETFADMKVGMLIGLIGIYIVLAWVFSSYGWPLVVMMAIPFGLIGAIMGHWWMGLDMTILSMFGFFGLSGIVINDSIILVSFYKRLREQGMAINEALEEAVVQRVRAVLLTSLTTIGGLTPLLFETSLQAQFLIPMAAAIAFGLMFSTFLILLVIPSILSIYESASHRFSSQMALKQSAN